MVEAEIALVGERGFEASGGACRATLAEPGVGRAIGEQRHVEAGAPETVRGEESGNARPDDRHFSHADLVLDSAGPRYGQRVHENGPRDLGRGSPDLTSWKCRHVRCTT